MAYVAHSVPDSTSLNDGVCVNVRFKSGFGNGDTDLCLRRNQFPPRSPIKPTDRIRGIGVGI